MSCGQIGMPTGGARDSIPPRLVNASPKENSVNVSSNKITLTFDEYIELKDVQANVFISPYPKKAPSIDYRLKTVTVNLKDSLLPNTTYSINFGNAIVDNNEGNPFKEMTYVFSTGNSIDSLTLGGKVIIAETGKTDSSIIALLYRNASDSSVQKNKPNYMTKLKGDGSFEFKNLPAGQFDIYAVKDGDGSRNYNSKKELFAFLDGKIMVSENSEPVLLYASAVEKGKGQTAPKLINTDKKLKYSSSLTGQLQDLLTPLELFFNKPLKIFDSAKLIVKDSNSKAVSILNWSIDSSRTKITLSGKWQEDMLYSILLDSTAFADSTDLRLTKNDTLRFTTKKEADYGKVVLRFENLDLKQNPVLQFVLGNDVKESYPLTNKEWSKNLINPGEYEIRILFDENKNGQWDHGDYSKKLQPEKAITLSQKLAVKANWDNERDIKL